MLEGDLTLADLTAMRPAATAVLYRHGIEFCCRGARPLHEACREASVQVATLLEEIAAEEARGGGAVNWATRPLSELVDHIVTVFHAGERRLLAEISAQLSASAAHRSGRGGQRALSAVVARLQDELTEHMAKEEAVLFPWIRAGSGGFARVPIQVMLLEHEATLRLLDQVRDCRTALAAAAAPGDPLAIVDALGALDRDIREHIHLENNILFTRALRGEP